MFLRVAGSLARERRSMRTAAEVALCSAAAPVVERRHLKSEPPFLRLEAQEGR
jgi:hypothetical protein